VSTIREDSAILYPKYFEVGSWRQQRRASPNCIIGDCIRSSAADENSALATTNDKPGKRVLGSLHKSFRDRIIETTCYSSVACLKNADRIICSVPFLVKKRYFQSIESLLSRRRPHLFRQHNTNLDMFSFVSRASPSLNPEKASKMIVLAKTGLRRLSTGASKQRSFMSSMTQLAPEEDCHFTLILGKPGGGKGTISGKILKVQILFLYS
jgi:hypothetical protein